MCLYMERDMLTVTKVTAKDCEHKLKPKMVGVVDRN
jgi:hypothetical protein